MANLTPEAQVYVDDYQNNVKRLAMVASLIKDIPVALLLEEVKRAESVGPILDSTLWREKSDAMAMDKKLLEAALPLVEWAQSMPAPPAEPQPPEGR